MKFKVVWHKIIDLYRLKNPVYLKLNKDTQYAFIISGINDPDKTKEGEDKTFID